MGRALVYRYGDPLDVIPALVAEVGASAVYAAREAGCRESGAAQVHQHLSRQPRKHQHPHHSALARVIRL